MIFRGSKDRNGFRFTADLFPRPVVRLFGFLAVVVALFLLAQNYLLPNHRTVVDIPGKGGIETGPIAVPPVEYSTIQPERRKEPEPQHDAHAEDIIPTMNAPDFPGGIVPKPRSKPYGDFYVRLRELGDGEWIRIPVPCDLDRPLPKACFMPPDERKKHPVTQRRFR
jgi:hypothetical protein